MEQLGLELVPIEDAATAGGDFTMPQCWQQAVFIKSKHCGDGDKLPVGILTYNIA